MKSNFTNFYIKLSLYLVVFIGLSANNAFAQGFAGGRTYVVNGQADQVAPVDTFVNLMGVGNAGAITYLNTNGIDVTQPIGTVTILLDAGYSGVEPSAIQVGSVTGSGYPNMSVTRPVVLKPKAGLNFVISTTALIAANGSLFRIFGSTDFSIEGSGTVGQRNLTFSMGAALQVTTSAKVIDIIPASANRIRNVSIRNCIIVGNSTTTAVNTYAGIFFGGSTGTTSNAVLGTNYNINYINNVIMAVQNGIHHRGFPTNGTSFPCQDTGINIINNTIGEYVNPITSTNLATIGGLGSNLSGIYLQTAANSTISGNIIRNTISPITANVNGNFSGIRLDGAGSAFGLDSNIRVTKNQIYGIYSNVASAGVSGIRVSLGTNTTPRRLLIANNSISKIASINGGSSITSVGSYTAGILVDNSSTDVGLEVLFNSINLLGDTMGANSVSGCFVTGTNTKGGIVLMNNSFSNRFGQTVGNLSGYQNYVIICAANNSEPFTYSNFNNYYSNTFGGGYAFVAGIVKNNLITHISTLKSYISFSPSDTFSYAIIPPTTNDTVLSVADGLSHRTYNRGYALTTLNQFSPSISNLLINKISDDIFGNPRTGLGRFTSIGCHQWSGDSIDIPSALVGGQTYNIDGFSSPPLATTPNTGSFKNLAEAIAYVNSYGIYGNQNNVTLQITSSYQRETTWIPALIDYPGSNPSLKIIIKPQAGHIDTIWSPNVANPANTSVFRLMGAKNVTIDGLLNNTVGVKNLTFMFRNNSNTPNSRVIGIVPTDVSCQNITIKNINIVGQSTDSTINTYAGIYYGHPFITSVPPSANDTLRTISNNNIYILDNLIQAVRSGIVVRGSSANPLGTAPDFKGTAAGVLSNRISNLKIVGNIIGGTIAPKKTVPTNIPTTYIGGANDQAGIFIQGVEAALIDSNVIRNCNPRASLSVGFRGIDIVESSSKYPNFDVNVSKNFIYNLATSTGANCIGIRTFITAPNGTRGHFYSNNSISNILSVGSGSAISATNPTGILIDASVVSNTVEVVTLVNNTINMSGNNILSANSGITALYLGSNIKSGISSVNNIFGVTADRTTTGNMYAVTVLSPTTPFTLNTTFNIQGSDFNAYFVSGKNPNPLNNILMATPAANPTTRTNINTLRLFTDKNSDLSSFSFPASFVADTIPDLLTVTAGSRYTAGSSVSIVTFDIYGNPRSFGSQMGAVRFELLNTPLQPNATYQINGVDNFPTTASANVGSFKTLRSAVDYLNAFGVGLSFVGLNPVRLALSSGYVGETDTFTSPITIFDYPNAGATVPVIVTVAAGRQDTIRFTNFIKAPVANSSLIRISSGSYFGFDGSNNLSNSRDLTIVMPDSMKTSAYKMIDIVGGQSSIFANSLSTSNNFINNCNLIGYSTPTTINTFAAIYMGGITATPSNAAGLGANNNNSFSNNFIGGCQYGIYLRGNGVRGQGDVFTTISGNEIGGNKAPNGVVATNYFGGINNAAGIFCVGQYRANISRNKIQNNLDTFINPRGIELGIIIGSNTVLDSANIIDGNIIKNIKSIKTGSAAYGIYMNFGADVNNTLNSTRISNNMISGVTATGGATLMTGVYGIAIDANPTVAFTDPNIGIYYNSVNLGLANTVTTGRTACLAISDKFVLNATSLISKSGFKMSNNLFSNKLGGINVASGVKASAVQVGALLSPFTTSDNNNYYSNAINATNTQITANAVATQIVYNDWDSINIYTGSDLYSTNLTAPFINDSNLFIGDFSSSVIYGVGKPVAGISTDVVGNTRNGFAPTIGAHEYTGGNEIDSVLPRVSAGNSVVCLNPTNNEISFIVVDKNYVSDVLTYRINGGSPINLPVSATSNSINSKGYLVRTYTIPASAFTGGVIEYKIIATDISGNNGIYPNQAIKEWDTLATGIDVYPYTMNFEDGLKGWSNQTLTNNAYWNLGAYGSTINPSHATENGIKCAMFPSATLPVGASARMTSPCFKLSVLQRPILRFRFSQSNLNVTKRDSIIVTILQNGFPITTIKSVLRPNAQSPYPDWFTYEACLSDYRGANGNLYSFQFDAYSAGSGNNILIDSIQVLDDFQNQVATGVIPVICNIDQPITITIPNTDNSYIYRVMQTDNAGNGLDNNSIILDSAKGNSGSIVLTLANRQIDTLFYKINAINYGSGTYQPASSFVEPIYCKNDLPGVFTTVIRRFSRPLEAQGGYIIPDFTIGAFNGAANIGDQYIPDAVKPNNSLTYEILTPNDNISNASYGTNWTLLNTSITSVDGGTPATNVVFTAPTANANAKIKFTPTSAEGDTMFVIKTTLRFLPTNCDTTVYRFVKVASPIAYGFVTSPRVDTACTGTALNFTIVQGNLANTTQLWTWDDNSTPTSFANTPHIWSAPGTYRVVLRVTSNLGISDTVSKLITVLPAPSAAYTVSSTAIVCQNDSTYFTVNNQAAGLTYLWTFPGNITRPNPVTSFSFATADTNYSVTLKVTNPANGCNSINNRVFPSYAKPTAKFTVSSHCQGQYMPYTDSSFISNGDRLGHYWTFSTGEARQSNSFQIKFANSGNVNVHLRLTSAAGCEDSVSHLVTVYETPKPDFIFEAACTNDSTIFTNKTTFAAGVQNAGYVWDFGDNSAIDSRQDPKNRYLNNNSGDPFIVKLIANNKIYPQCKDSIFRNVLVKTAPLAVAELGGIIKTGISSYKVCQGNTVTFTSKSFSSSGASLTCNWVFGNGPSSGACNSLNNYADAGTYNWSLTATADGCIDTKSGSITVIAKPSISFTKQSFSIPGKFTENNRKVFTPSDLAIDQNQYSWNFGDADSTTTNQRVPDFTYNKKGTFKVRMQVTTAEGCVVNYSDTVVVNVGVSVGEELAAKFNLNAYPNPFANNTVIGLSLTKPENITITITDILGRVISTTNHNNVASGKHEFELTSNNFTAAGTYIVKVQIGDEMVVKSVVKQ